jgi:hypothetical protein
MRAQCHVRNFLFFITLLFFGQNTFAACYITLGRLKMDGGGSAVLSIKSPDDGLCTKEDLVKTWQDIKDPFDAERFVALVTAFFMGVEVDDHKWKNFNEKSKASFFLGETPSANSGENLPNFESIFPVSFDAARFGSQTEFDDNLGESLFNPLTIARLSLQGYGLAEVSGSFKSLGSELSFAFNTVIYGRRTFDQASFQAQLGSMAKVNGVLSEFNAALVENIQQLNASTENVKLYNETLFTLISDMEASSVQSIETSKKYLETAETNISAANATIVSTVTQAKLESEMTAEEIARNREGMIKASQLQDLEQNISREIDNFASNKSLPFLKNISQSYLQDKNPLRKNQYRAVLDKYTNKYGFVTTWYDALEANDRFAFTSSEDSQYGSMIRQIGNQALGSMIFEKGDVDKMDARRAWQLVARADKLIGKMDATPLDKIHALRFLNRAQVMLDYVNKNSKVSTYKNFTTNDTVSNMFGYSVRAETNEGFEFVSVANRLVKYQAALNQTTVKIHGALALERAFLAMGSVSDRDEFFAAIDSVWGVVDYLDGADVALGQWVWNTGAGVYQMVRHPIDSGEALLTAISNLGAVWGVISRGVQERYQQLQNCDVDTFACGEASGAIAGMVIDTVAFIKAIKAAPELINLARTATAATARSLQGIFKSLVELGFDSREFLSEFVKRAKGVEGAETVIADLGNFSENTKGALQGLGVKTPDDLIALASAARGIGSTVDRFIGMAQSLGIGTIEQVKRVVEWLKTPLIPGEAGTVQIAWKRQIFVDLASTQKRTHILVGDSTGGGHMFPGKPGKSVFPQSWSGDKIMHEVADVVTDPKIVWQPNRVVAGKQRFKATGIRDGVEIVVIVEPEGVGIVTAWPQSGPGVIRNP